LKKNEEYFDFGCGWGTLLCHAAKHFGAKCTGITLANEQVKWGHDQAKKMNVDNSVNLICCDYREISKHSPSNKKYDAISCVEMAEHVGVRHINSFFTMVYNMLKHDGKFFFTNCVPTS
jgi:cyclopropane fatty-acyl-phospholipid synthase-like methyltransferase